MKFHHLGIACEKIETTLDFVRSAFSVLNVHSPVFDEKQNVNLCLIELEDGTNIELISGERINALVKKQQTLYHTCWEVENIEDSVKKLYDNGASLILPPTPAVLFDHRRVAFLYSPVGIIELLEQSN